MGGLAQGTGTAWPSFLETPQTSQEVSISCRYPKGTGEVWGGWRRHQLGVETPHLAGGLAYCWAHKVLNKCILNERSKRAVKDREQGLGPLGPACSIQKIAV